MDITLSFFTSRMPINVKAEALERAQSKGNKESEERFSRKWHSKVPYLKCRNLSEIYEIISIILLNEGPNDAAAFIHAFTNSITPLSEILAKGTVPNSHKVNRNTSSKMDESTDEPVKLNKTTSSANMGSTQQAGSAEKNSKSSIIIEELSSKTQL